MRLPVGVISILLLAVMLTECFFVFLLPRRVRRDPRIARGLLLGLWVPWWGAGELAGRGGSPRARPAGVFPEKADGVRIELGEEEWLTEPPSVRISLDPPWIEDQLKVAWISW